MGSFLDQIPYNTFTSEKCASDSNMYFTYWKTVGLYWGESNHNGHSKTQQNMQEFPSYLWKN